MACNHCDEFSRAHLLRRAVAEAGRGLPRSSAGCRCPPGPGSAGARSSRSAPACSPSTAPRSCGLRALEEGIAQAAGRRRPLLVSIFLDGGIDSLSCSRHRRPALPQLRPTWGSPPGAGTAFAEDPRLRWHPAAARARRPAPRGQAHRVARRSATRPRPVALHLAPLLGGRRARPNERTGWMGRFLDPIGTTTTRSRGSRSTAGSRPRWRPRTDPVAAIDGPTYDLWAPGLGRAEDADVRRRRRSAAAPPPPDPASQAAGAAAAQSMQLAGARSRSAPSSRRRRLPGRTPGSPTTSRPRRDARRRPADPLRGVRARAATTPTTTRPTLATRRRARLRHDPRLPARPRGARDRRPGHDAGLVRVRPPAEENGSGTDHGAAGYAFVIGTQVQGEMVGEFPASAARRGRQPPRTSDFRASTARSSSSGSMSTPTR